MIGMLRGNGLPLRWFGLVATCLVAAMWVSPAARAQDDASSDAELDQKFPPTRWEQTIVKLEQAARQNPPSENCIVFVGSSSIVRWDLKKSFPDLPVLNQGFGGSHLIDSVHYADRIVLPYRPSVVVVYAGDNDLAGGKTPQRVLKDYQKFVSKVHQQLPRTRIVYIAIKPSIRRWELIKEVRKANALIAEAASHDDRLAFVDVDQPMIGSDGKPRKELLAADGLHLSEAGYELWTKLVRPQLQTNDGE